VGSDLFLDAALFPRASGEGSIGQHQVIIERVRFFSGVAELGVAKLAAANIREKGLLRPFGLGEMWHLGYSLRRP
jgi:hypothetical protein